MIYDSILGTIGRTPIVRVNRLAPAHATIYVKCEYFNPLSSVKDRLAIAIIEDAAQAGYSHWRTALVGAATFFLPCGFTQAVQIYAISTANPLTAGLVMATFAVGTTPGLLALPWVSRHNLASGGGKAPWS